MHHDDRDLVGIERFQHVEPVELLGEVGIEQRKCREGIGADSGIVEVVRQGRADVALQRRSAIFDENVLAIERIMELDDASADSIGMIDGCLWKLSEEGCDGEGQAIGVELFNGSGACRGFAHRNQWDSQSIAVVAIG